MKLEEKDLHLGQIVYHSHDDVSEQEAMDDFGSTAHVVIRDPYSGAFFLVPLEDEISKADCGDVMKLFAYPFRWAQTDAFSTQEEATRTSIECEIEYCTKQLEHAKRLLSEFEARQSVKNLLDI